MISFHIRVSPTLGLWHVAIAAHHDKIKHSFTIITMTGPELAAFKAVITESQATGDAPVVTWEET